VFKYYLSHCYSIGQVIKSLASVCLSVSQSVCLSSLLRPQLLFDIHEILHSGSNKEARGHSIVSVNSSKDVAGVAAIGANPKNTLPLNLLP